jgi:hypothetical protein
MTDSAVEPTTDVEMLGDYVEDDEVIVPPRQKLLNPVSWALIFALVAGGGFLAGAKVQKGRAATTVVTPAGAGGFGGQARAGAAGATPGAIPGAPTTTVQTGAGGQGGGPAVGATPAVGGVPAQAGGGQGGGTFGTIKLVDNGSIYIQDASGNVVKVTPTSDASVTVSKPGTIADFKPGDTVAVRGTADADGTIAATSISSGGARGNRGG